MTDLFKVEDIRLAGFHVEFRCFDCRDSVKEVGIFQTSDYQNFRFFLNCHNRSMLVDLPMRMFVEIPNWRRSGRSETLSTLRFVVGFNGTWGVKLRNYDWLLQAPRVWYGAVGVFRQWELEKLFGPPMVGYELDSEFFNITNVEHDFEFPAEFWVPTETSRRLAQDRGISLNPCA